MTTTEYLAKLEDANTSFSEMTEFEFLEKHKLTKQEVRNNAAQHLATILRGIEAGEFKLVPCEASKKMTDAGMRSGVNTPSGYRFYSMGEAYKAMIATPDIIGQLIGGE